MIGYGLNSIFGLGSHGKEIIISEKERERKKKKGTLKGWGEGEFNLLKLYIVKRANYF